MSIQVFASFTIYSCDYQEQPQVSLNLRREASPHRPNSLPVTSSYREEDSHHPQKQFEVDLAGGTALQKHQRSHKPAKNVPILFGRGKRSFSSDSFAAARQLKLSKTVLQSKATKRFYCLRLFGNQEDLFKGFVSH